MTRGMSRNSFDARSEWAESSRHRNEGKGARKMTVNDLVIAVLAFELVNGPIAAVAYFMGTLAVALAKVAWFALRWLRWEARGALWHITDSGEPYRIMWLRRNGEYLYDAAATRDQRANEELTTLRARRIRLGKAAAIAVVAIIV